MSIGSDGQTGEVGRNKACRHVSRATDGASNEQSQEAEVGEANADASRPGYNSQLDASAFKNNSKHHRCDASDSDDSSSNSDDSSSDSDDDHKKSAVKVAEVASSLERTRQKSDQLIAEANADASKQADDNDSHCDEKNKEVGKEAEEAANAGEKAQIALDLEAVELNLDEAPGLVSEAETKAGAETVSQSQGEVVGDARTVAPGSYVQTSNGGGRDGDGNHKQGGGDNPGGSLLLKSGAGIASASGNVHPTGEPGGDANSTGHATILSSEMGMGLASETGHVRVAGGRGTELGVAARIVPSEEQESWLNEQGRLIAEAEAEAVERKRLEEEATTKIAKAKADEANAREAEDAAKKKEERAHLPGVEDDVVETGETGGTDMVTGSASETVVAVASMSETMAREKTVQARAESIISTAAAAVAAATVSASGPDHNGAGHNGVGVGEEEGVNGSNDLVHVSVGERRHRVKLKPQDKANRRIMTCGVSRTTTPCTPIDSPGKIGFTVSATIQYGAEQFQKGGMLRVCDFGCGDNSEGSIGEYVCGTVRLIDVKKAEGGAHQFCPMADPSLDQCSVFEIRTLSKTVFERLTTCGSGLLVCNAHSGTPPCLAMCIKQEVAELQIPLVAMGKVGPALLVVKDQENYFFAMEEKGGILYQAYDDTRPGQLSFSTDAPGTIVGAMWAGNKQSVGPTNMSSTGLPVRSTRQRNTGAMSSAATPATLKPYNVRTLKLFKSDLHGDRIRARWKTAYAGVWASLVGYVAKQIQVGILGRVYV